jgi:hypothetical protein
MNIETRLDEKSWLFHLKKSISVFRLCLPWLSQALSIMNMCEAIIPYSYGQKYQDNY